MSGAVNLYQKGRHAMTPSPRPWKVVKERFNRFTIYAGADACHKLIAFVHVTSEAGERDANAALIVHAVNSFDEAKALIETMVCMYDGGDKPSLNERDKWLTDAKAVLAKMERGDHAI